MRHRLWALKTVLYWVTLSTSGLPSVQVGTSLLFPRQWQLPSRRVTQGRSQSAGGRRRFPRRGGGSRSWRSSTHWAPVRGPLKPSGVRGEGVLMSFPAKTACPTSHPPTQTMPHCQRWKSRDVLGLLPFLSSIFEGKVTVLQTEVSGRKE